MTLPPVFVLGCGPSGLVAAHAASALGYEVTVLSRRRKSQLWGCQYLHRTIDGLPKVNGAEVSYTLEGTVEGYLDKVYGDDYDGTVSPQEMTEFHYAHDLRKTYDHLWRNWGDRVVDVPVFNGQHAAGWIPDLCTSGIVFSTIPRTAMCANTKHVFESVNVWAIGDSDSQRVPVRPPGDNQVICNGLRDVAWYRCSQVFGYATVEWPDRRRPPFSGVALVEKPVATNCDCLPQVQYVGRYGAWQKGVLVHQVYDRVFEVLNTMQGRLF